MRSAGKPARRESQFSSPVVYATATQAIVDRVRRIAGGQCAGGVRRLRGPSRRRPIGFRPGSSFLGRRGKDVPSRRARIRRSRRSKFTASSVSAPGQPPVGAGSGQRRCGDEDLHLGDPPMGHYFTGPSTGTATPSTPSAPGSPSAAWSTSSTGTENRDK